MYSLRNKLNVYGDWEMKDPKKPNDDAILFTIVFGMCAMTLLMWLQL